MTEFVCKGSMALGTGCGKCARCKAETRKQLPTEHMVVAGFEAVSMFHETDAYKAMTGCQGAAESARVCWAAMVAALPDGEMPRQDRAPSDAEILAVYKDCFWMTDMYEDVGRIKFAREILARYGKGGK